MKIIIALIRKDLEQQWRMYILSSLAFLALLVVMGLTLRSEWARPIHMHWVIIMTFSIAANNQDAWHPVVPNIDDAWGGHS